MCYAATLEISILFRSLKSLVPVLDPRFYLFQSHSRVQASLRKLRSEPSVLRGADGRDHLALRAAAGGLVGAALLHRLLAGMERPGPGRVAEAGGVSVEAATDRRVCSGARVPARVSARNAQVR